MMILCDNAIQKNDFHSLGKRFSGQISHLNYILSPQIPKINSNLPFCKCIILLLDGILYESQPLSQSLRGD